MKVIVIFTYGISLKHWVDSGIYDREMLLYQGLEKEHGIEFTFITFGDSEDLKYFKGFDKSNILPVYSRIKHSKLNFFNFIKSIYFSFSLSKEFTDCQLIKTNQLSGSWIGIILKKVLGIPLIVRTGYNIYEFKVKENKSVLVQTFYKYLTKLSLKYSDLYIVTSNKDNIFLQNMVGTNTNIMVIPNYVPKINLNEADSRHINKIISVGRLEKQKNFFDLLKHLKQTEFEIDIVGDGSERSKLIEFAKKENIKVNFLGKLEFQNLNNLYKEYKIFISNSSFEGNPKTILEAMANGCCIVATNIESHREIVVDEVNGFLYEEVSNVKAIIAKVMSDVNIFNKISRNNYDVVEQKYLLDLIKDKEVEIYRKLIKN
tara:strand:- start:26174 stop:27292 length:1119 start_codon:yes stop_codon:yes gene_type:complete